MPCKTCYVNKGLYANTVYRRHSDGMEDDVGFHNFHFLIL
jgi:hypothetical protein